MIRRHKSLIVSFLFFLTILGGCGSQELSDEKTEFSVLAGDYAIQLPTKWEEVDDITSLFTNDTVYGAQDTSSLSYMMIRGYAYELMTYDSQLIDYGETLLGERYILENIIQESFKVGDYFGRHYRLQSEFNEKSSWLDIYLVSVENAVIEFQFFSPIDRSAENREALFTESVESLTVESISQAVENQDSEASVGEGINEDYTLRMTSYRVMEENGERLLVIRYLSTNTGSQAFIPSEIWSEGVTISQDNQPLQLIPEVSDSEVNYLLEIGTQPLASEKSIESAAIYQLTSTSDEVTMEFDSDMFISSETTILPIGGS